MQVRIPPYPLHIGERSAHLGEGSLVLNASAGRPKGTLENDNVQLPRRVHKFPVYKVAHVQKPSKDEDIKRNFRERLTDRKDDQAYSERMDIQGGSIPPSESK